jgi:type II secretory ATPase GspE/PulE/Tfp pilus assembly ATPase PilB-like protein
MSEKIAKTICRYAQEKGHSHLHLEKKGATLVCTCGRGENTDYLRLDRETEISVAETFRRLVGASENELFANKRFKITDKQNLISGRATLLPSREGEKLIITLSSETPFIKRISALGANKEQQEIYRQGIKKRAGVIIIVSPEENGATSTYYSLLSLAAAGRSAYSLETYPVNPLSGINTINLQKYSSPTTALERVARFDSELIGIDAPLNSEDLKNVFRLAATGRLVILTLSAKDAASAVKILRRTGLSAAAIAEQLIFISAQKLFKRPCTRCLHSFDPGPEIKKTILSAWPSVRNFWPKKLFQNHGCKHCRQGNIAPKTAIFEIMRFLPDGRLQAGYQPLIQEALAKAELGLINIEEIAAWAQIRKKI